MVVIKAKVKEIIGDFNMGSDFLPTLNAEVQSMIQKAVERAKANNRRTVMSKDL